MIFSYFTWLLESSIILAAFAFLYQCFLRRLTFFKLNRLYLILSIFCSFLLPFFATSYMDNLLGGFVVSHDLSINLTSERIQNSIDRQAGPIVQGGNSIVGFNFSLLLQVLFVIYLIGFIYKAIQFIQNLGKVFSLILRGDKKAQRGYTAVDVDSNHQAFSFLHFIFLPVQNTDLDPQDLKQILYHEQVHVKEKHTWDLLLLELTGIIWWFHPFIFLIKLFVREIHEYQADLVVTTKTDDVQQYGKLLIKLSTQISEPLLNTFSNKQIIRRINMLTQTKSKPMEKLKFLFIIPVLAVSLILCSFIVGTSDKSPVNPKLKNPDTSNSSSQPVTIRKITWLGNTIFNDVELSKELALEVGDLYDAEDLNRRLNYNPGGADISSLYMDKGYLFFNITPKEVIAGSSVDLAFMIEEGQQVNIGKIIIKGNKRISTAQVLEAIDFESGDLFNRSKLINSQKDISEMGYFNPENVGINPSPYQTPGGEWVVDIVIVVEEI